jgi:SAM-dependent methyltransferase
MGTQHDAFAEATARARAVWTMGDFARAGAEQVIVAERLVRAVDIHPTESVLDVAAGSGNAAIAASRRGARVVATDFVPQLLDVARRRAGVEGLALETQTADAQELPFDDASFDVVLSTFGVIFAPDQDRAAGELVRVCRPGGRIGLTAWTPNSLIASNQAIAGRYAPSAPGLRSPTEWGTESRIRELLGDAIGHLTTRVRTTDLCSASAAERVTFNRTYVGPTKAIFDRLDPVEQEDLAGELTANLELFNRATDGTLVAAAEYLEVVAVRTDNSGKSPQ